MNNKCAAFSECNTVLVSIPKRSSNKEHTYLVIVHNIAGTNQDAVCLAVRQCYI